jgi:3-keto-disaccharide hydrolase
MTTRLLVLRVASIVLLLGAAGSSLAQPTLGYTNTPIIPGTQWKVHDGARPQPRIVTPGPSFSQLAAAPSDATVLFDGKDLSKWQSGEADAKWKIVEGCMMSVRGAGNIRTRDKFPDFQLHLEFATPAEVSGASQGRGNSGVLINGMYEVQVLDSYKNPTYPDGQAGAIYGQTPPLVNASKPPGEWQTYDIFFESPQWDSAGQLIKKANVTVIHNGVLLHHRREYIGATDGVGGVKHTSLGAYLKSHPPESFIELQDHNNPVRFRNIWIRPIGEYDH